MYQQYNMSNIDEIQARIIAIEVWIQNNIGHANFEDKIRELNLLRGKVESKKQSEERKIYPDRYRNHISVCWD